MAAKEAQARIKINKLLENAGWRFLDDINGKANIQLEPHVTLSPGDTNFESAGKGFVDFLLLDDKGFPFVVLEAKAEDKNPLVGKEQARKYAKSLNCRFVLLSNGNLHYFWDLQTGNPYHITQFPTPDSIRGRGTFQPSPQRLSGEPVERDYIARTQMPSYADEAGWKNNAERDDFTNRNGLRFLRPYQVRAIHALQADVKKGRDRFLFEMATGTGKTLTCAAVLKLFLQTGNARRALFLVDRIELEQQAQKAFNELLKNDYKTAIYKEQRDDWRKAEIVVTTVQSLLHNNKFQRLFSPTDFDLVISDEAHRSIGGNARAVFEYFVGYKLGLTATPKDYLKKFDAAAPTTRDPRELERRMLLDTYKTFGCDSGTPTFQYGLLEGVGDAFLINPVIVDARTEITARLLSEKGYAVAVPAAPIEASADNSTSDDAVEQAFFQKDFEKKFFSEPTNRMLCETFLKHALRDPFTGEIGKGLMFAVSQNHAAKLTQILNELADQMFPGKYQSDFAVQVTSQITDAAQYTSNFTHNKLMGSANFNEHYKTSKARVCVTVGMMTTGYDCPDLLNIALLRPIFSPSEFIQIKGRGTRKHGFASEFITDTRRRENGALPQAEKTRFKLFDFWANCEYFDQTFNYDEVLELPRPTPADPGLPPGVTPLLPAVKWYENAAHDPLTILREEAVGYDGMKIDRMFFQKFEETAREDNTLQKLVDDERWEQAADYVTNHLLNKPTEFFTLEKLRKATGSDRRLSLREMLEKAFGRIPGFKTRGELLDEEFDKFVLAAAVQEVASLPALKYFFTSYLTDGLLRDTLEKGNLAALNTNPTFTMADFRAVPPKWRTLVPEYVKDYVSLNSFL